MKKGRSFLVTLLLMLHLFAVAGLLASYCAAYISPDKLWLFAFFGLAYPIFLIINMIFIFLWLFLWKRYIFFSLLPLLAGWNSLLAIYPFRFAKPETTSNVTMKVVSFNVHSLYGNLRAENQHETRSKVTEFLAGQHAVLICIQEFYAIGEDFSQTLSKFSSSIHLDYSYFMNYQEFINKRKINAIATFSRFPIVNTGYFKLQDHSTYAIFSDIVVNKDTIRVYNLHLESIRFGNDDYSFYSHLTEPDKEGTPINIGSKRMLWKLRKAFILRSKQVNILAGHIAGCNYPVILTGDFNDTPSSYTYHKISTLLSDSYKEAGEGLFGSTYAGKFPSFRIDYIFHSRKIKSLLYKKIDVDLSDHYPITSTLVIMPGQAIKND